MVDAYIWEQIPLKTLHINKFKWTTMLVNWESYTNAVNWLWKIQKLTIKSILTQLLSWKILKEYLWWLSIKQNEEWNSIMNYTYNNQNININIEASDMNIWKNHDRIWYISIGNKKYFCKKICKWKSWYIDWYDSVVYDINSINEYKWLEYIYQNSTLDIIKPVLAAKNWDIDLIIYPYVWDHLKRWDTLKSTHKKNFNQVYKKILPQIKNITKDKIVYDIKEENMWFDTINQKIYIFDPLYKSIN